MTTNTEKAFFEEYSIKIKYPLTLERILALEEIILKIPKIKYIEWQFTNKWNKETPTGYVLWVNYTNGCGTYAFGKTRSDALLSLLTQLRPELSEEAVEEVKGVFG